MTLIAKEIWESNNASLDPIDILSIELHEENVERKLTAINKLSVIAKALGEERTRDDLMPFLTEVVGLEEEVMIAVAINLPKLAELVGGSSFVHHLYGTLEVLACVPDPAVKNAAVESLKILSAQQTQENLEKHFVHLVLKMADNSSGSSSQVASCSLFSTCYPRVSTRYRKELLGAFKNLCQDIEPDIRRAAISNLGEFCHVIEPKFLVYDMLPILLNVMRVSLSSIRVLAVEACSKVVNLLSGPRIDGVLDVLHYCARDVDWNVRRMFAMKLTDWQTAAGPELTETKLAPLLPVILRDTSAEVRAMVVSKVKEFCENMNNTSIQKDIVALYILPYVPGLAMDYDHRIRIALAEVLMSLSPIIGIDQTRQILVPFFSLLVRDESPQVRLTIVSSNLNCSVAALGFREFSRILRETVLQMRKCREWRFRCNVVQNMAIIAHELGVEFFDDAINSLCVHYLRDRVFAVREAAVLTLKNLIEEFGREWAQNIIDFLKSLSKDPNYLHRMTYLFSVNILGSVCGREIIKTNLLSTAIEMASDKIPNVRFNVAKTLQNIILLMTQREDREIIESIMPVLALLEEDSDEDVQYYANKAMKVLCLRLHQEDIKDWLSIIGDKHFA